MEKYPDFAEDIAKMIKSNFNIKIIPSDLRGSAINDIDRIIMTIKENPVIYPLPDTRLIEKCEKHWRLTLPEEASTICADFFRTLKARKGDDFGNGREARRLFHAAKEEMALRAVTDPTVDSALSDADLRRAVDRLLEQEKEKKSSMSPIGFGA